MAESSQRDRLIVWGLTMFHTSLIVVGLIAAIYSGGGLGSQFKSIGTLGGLALFATLWLTNWWCTRQALRGVDRTSMAQPISVWRLLLRGLAWGGINGALFLLLLVGLLAAYSVALAGLGHPSFAGVLSALFELASFTFAASFSAFLIGGILGLLFALVDSIVLEVSRRISLRLSVPVTPTTPRAGD